MLTLFWDICIITNVPRRRSGGMADALDQAGNTVWVQVPPPAPTLGGKTFVLPPIFYIFIFMN